MENKYMESLKPRSYWINQWLKEKNLEVWKAMSLRDGCFYRTKSLTKETAIEHGVLGNQ